MAGVVVVKDPELVDEAVSRRRWRSAAVLVAVSAAAVLVDRRYRPRS